LGRAGLDGPPGVALHVAGVFGEADRKTAAGALRVALSAIFSGLRPASLPARYGVNDEGGDTVAGGGPAEERIKMGRK